MTNQIGQALAAAGIGIIGGYFLGRCVSAAPSFDGASRHQWGVLGATVIGPAFFVFWCWTR